MVLHADRKKVIGEVFNLGSGFDLNVLSIAKMILHSLGRPESLISFMPDRPGQVQHHVSSTAKAEKILGIRPAIKFEEGLEKTIRWYANNRGWWERLFPVQRVAILDKKGNSQYY
jgi:dTDP-glucose 4,6-dehydratase